MSKPTRYYSDKHEKRTAKKLGGSVQISSGSSPFYKGDVFTQSCLVECKTCVEERKSFSIKKEWLTKVREQALAMGKQYPILAFDFGSGENYYVLDERTFRQFVSFVEQEQIE